MLCNFQCLIRAGKRIISISLLHLTAQVRFFMMIVLHDCIASIISELIRHSVVKYDSDMEKAFDLLIRYELNVFSMQTFAQNLDW